MASVEPCSVLPVHLVDHIVAIQIQRRRRDPALGLSAAQRVRREHDHITDVDVATPKLTEESGATCSHHNDLHTVERDRIKWGVVRLSSCGQR